MIKDSGTRQVFETGAQRDCHEGKGRFDLLPVGAIEALAQHYEAGAKKYTPRNWEQGIPIERYLDSGLRHAFKALRGDIDEDHLIAAAWNMLCAWQTRQWIEQGRLPKELDTIRKEQHETLVL